MNAVKNCLVVLAAAVALASCSADPNSSSAGKAVLTVTPGSVALRAGTTAEVFASAIDPLGGAVNGTFALTGNGTGSDTSIFKAAIDTGYTPLSGGGHIATRTRIVVTAYSEGNGTFTVAGTGGSQIIAVRVGPDSLAFNAPVSSAHPTIGNTDTVTAPSGIRFTAGTGVSMTGSNGIAAPTVNGFSSDSTQVYIFPAPGAHGKFLLTGIANTTTPTITYAAATAESIYVDTLAFASFPATHSQATLAGNAVDTVTTASPDWKFTPDSRVTSGGHAGIFLGISADSTMLFVKPTPNTTGPLTVSALKYALVPTVPLTYPTSASVIITGSPDLGGDDPFAGPAVYSPTLGAGVLNGGFWDQLTFQNNGADNAIGDGDEQWYFITLTEAGDVTFTADWTGGGDLDMFIVDGGFASILSQDGATTAHPESATISPSAANTSYYVGITNSSGTVTGDLGLQISIAP